MNTTLKTILICLLINFKINAQAIKLKINTDLKSNVYNKSLTFENANLMHLFLNDTINKLHKTGYIDAEYIIEKKDSFYETKIISNKLIKIISINELQHVNDSTLLYIINKKLPIHIPFTEIDAQINDWLNKLEQNGQGLAKLALVNNHINDDTLNVTLKYHSDLVRNINQIIIEGYDKFPNGIKKDIERKFIGKNLNDKNSEKLNTYVKQLNFIQIIKPTEILFEQTKTSTYIYVQKRQSNKFDGYIGFSNNEKGKIQFNGYLDLSLNNILNKGELTELLWKSDGNKQTTFNFKTELPYILKTPVGINFAINIFKQDINFQTTNLSYGIKHYINYNTKFGIGYKANTSTYLGETTNGDNYNSKFITAQLNTKKYRDNNHIFNEIFSVDIDFGFGKRNSQINSNQKFIQSQIAFDIELNKKTYFNIKNITYYLKSKNYLVNELYRIGGAKTLRGFNENSLQGNTITAMLTEFRYILTKNIYANSITDYAYLNDKTSNKTTNLYSIGVGIGIINNNLNININYVKGSNFKENQNFKNSLIQITIKTLF